MALVRSLPSSSLPPDVAAIYDRYVARYGPFAEQVAVFAHVPAAVRHLMPMLMELREAATLPRRALELAIVTVSLLNRCAYCVGHHAPNLYVEGLSEAGVERLLAYDDHPELDEVDRLVVEYAIAAWTRSTDVPDALFDRLRARFTEAQIVELTLRITLTGFFNRFGKVLRIGEDADAHVGAALHEGIPT